MGSRCVQFARARRASSSCRQQPSSPGTKLLPVAWTSQSIKNELHEDCRIFPSSGRHLPFFSTPFEARRSDGYNDVGGVYDSAIAQDYWASRFGAGFFAGLRALQLDGEAGV